MENRRGNPVDQSLSGEKSIRKPGVPSKSVRMKIDEDVLTWLKEGGRGYQARVNAILRKAMQESLAH